jgi:hypothetical protein
MAITPLPNPNLTGTNPAIPTPAPVASPYAPPAVGNNQLNFGSALGQEVLGGPAKQQSYTNATTTKTPYAPTVGPINQYVAGTQALYGGGAPQISAPEQAGYSALNAATGTGAPATTALNTAAGEAGNIAGGSLLNINSNPYLASIMKTTGSQALQAVNSTFGGAERTGGGLNDYYGAKGMTDAENALGLNAYNTNVGATTTAIGETPNLVAGSLAGPAAQIAAGTAQTLRPYELNQNYGNILAQIAALGGTTNSQQSTETTGLAQTGGILGSILSGALTPQSGGTGVGSITPSILAG